MPLFHLIYMSSLVADEPEDLRAILEVSVRNNGQRRVTGMLLHADGNVLQVLEGEKEMVHQTFRAIERDDRHTGVFVLIDQEIASRQFASWSMGFRQLTQAELKKIPDATHVFKVQPDEISSRVLAGEALTILKTFADGTMSVV